MLLLALDTATPAVTVALHNGQRVVASSSTVDARRHGELLAPAIARVLAASGADRRDLSHIAVGVGPGPFTGLRVGVMTARTLGAALDVPVHGVCTLDVLAAAVTGLDAFAIATDARRKELYWACYERVDTGLRRVEGPHVSVPAELGRRLGADMPVLGRGAEMYADLRPYRAGPLDPDAAVLASCVVRGEAEVLPPDPLYLRRPDVAVPGPPKRVL